MSVFRFREGLAATLRHEPPLAIIDMTGDLVTATESELREAHQQAVAADAQHLLLNFAGVPYLNSSGIGVIIQFLSEAREHGRRLYFTGLTPHFHKIFQIMGLTQHGTWVDTEAEAKQAAQAVAGA